MFKGSLLMPLEDLLTAMPDDVRIPSLPTFSIITFRRALQKARKEMSSLPVTSAAGAAALVKGLPTLRVRGSLIGAVLGSVVALCWSVRRFFPPFGATAAAAMSAVDGLATRPDDLLLCRRRPNLKSRWPESPRNASSGKGHLARCACHGGRTATWTWR